MVVAVCSAADDPTTYNRETNPRVYDDFPYHFALIMDTDALETAIANRNIAWARWQDEGDELVNRVTDGERGYYGPYNEAQHDYEHAETELLRAQAHWRANRRAAAR